MTARIFIAGILGGVAMFIWNFVAHDVLPLGETGVREIPNEVEFVTGMLANFGENRGLYIFPGSGLGPGASRSERREAMRKNMVQKIETGPSGILIYRPPHPFNFPKLLGTQFATDILEAILAVFLLSSTRLLTAGSRILFTTIVGVVVAVGTHVPYWNWFGFPKRYTVSQMFIQIVGFFLIGVVSALVLKNRDPVRTSG